MSLLEFHNVFYESDNKVILKNININVEKGDFISIVGSSGSGKSTLLKLCNNLISPTKGKILYNNKNIMELNPTDLRKEIAYCFQIPHLFGNIVMDNLVFPFKIRNKKVDRSRIKILFNKFNMDEKIVKEKVLNLSGGEKQRISLIRTLIFYPKILLLDEVTSALDPENTLIVEGVINTLHKKGITILSITHNEKQSIKHANKLLTIENGEINSLEVLK